MATTTPTAIDLRTINWNDITVPGRACGPDITSNITLHNGQAMVQDPTVHATVTLPGVPQVSGEYPLNISIQPQFGQLAGGPQVAVLALTCSLSGVAAGLYETTAVFDAPDGTPHLLALLSDEEYGHIPGVDSALVPTAYQVTDGVIAVDGSYLQGDDPTRTPPGADRQPSSIATAPSHPAASSLYCRPDQPRPRPLHPPRPPPRRPRQGPEAAGPSPLRDTPDGPTRLPLWRRTKSPTAPRTPPERR